MTSTRAASTSSKIISHQQHRSSTIAIQAPPPGKQNPTRTIPDPELASDKHRLIASFYQEDNPEVMWIRLSGKGIKQVGFSPSSPVQVRIMKRCLVITGD